jgi:hypothetical protein
MSWIAWHEVSERAAADTHLAIRQGNRQSALALFHQAAEAECKALKELEPGKNRTLGITVVSAVSQAEQTAMRWLSSGQLPEFAARQLRELVQAIWIAEAMRNAGISFLPGQVIVSVKGGQTVPGGAPLDLIVEKVETVQALFYRTIEYLKGAPHRHRGGPALEIQEACRPWLFQTPLGSYQFSVAIQESRQPDFFKERGPHPEQVAEHFMAVLKASVEDPLVMLPELVPAEDYRTTFLKLTRNLAPTGKVLGAVEIREARELSPIVLNPDTRKAINATLRSTMSASDREAEQIELRGVLRALHLDRDWLELDIRGKSERVTGVAEAIDDIIGPMVNRKVIVFARRIRRHLGLISIEPDE